MDKLHDLEDERNVASLNSVTTGETSNEVKEIGLESENDECDDELLETEDLECEGLAVLPWLSHVSESRSADTMTSKAHTEMNATVSDQRSPKLAPVLPGTADIEKVEKDDASQMIHPTNELTDVSQG